MNIPWATEDPVAWARTGRKRRQLDALVSLANLGGRVVSDIRGRASDEEKTKREELELETRLGQQQDDVVQSAKSDAERHAEPPADQAVQMTDMGDTLSPQQQRGRLAELAAKATTPLRRALLGDPSQGARLRHIAQMKGMTERYGDIGKRLKAAGEYAKYSTDPGAIVKGVGGEQLGIPTASMKPLPPKAGGLQGLRIQGAQEALRAILGREPTTSEVTARVDKELREADRQKFASHEEIRAKYGKGKSTSRGSETLHGYLDETTGETLLVPPKEDAMGGMTFQDDVEDRRAKNHRLRPINRRVPLGAAATDEGGADPLGTGASGRFLDPDSGILFGTVE